MTTPLPNQIIREITPLSDKDCFYIAERYKTEFTYPIHNHSEFELNFTEKAAGVRRVVGDSSEVIGDYDLVLITGKDLEHVWEQNECRSKEIREITIQFSSDLFFKSFINKNQFDSIRRMLDKGAGVEKVEIIVKLKYEERAAVVNLWQLFLSFLYERPYKKNKFCINFYTKFGRLS